MTKIMTTNNPFFKLFSWIKEVKSRGFLLFVCLFFGGILSVLAQESVIYGKVSDAKTGVPLSGVTLSIAKTNVRTTTDAKGFYHLTVAENKRVLLLVRCVGYKSVQQELIGKDSLSYNISLQSTEKTLGEATVVARSEIRALKESAMPISVIGQRQLQGTASNINDVLARTVGVTVRNTGGLGSASRISVRGLEGKRMGMYIDETPMSQLGNFVALNDIPTDMIERI